ncbi:sensor histidine kinase, partial [Streptomyces sp. NPDC005970]
WPISTTPGRSVSRTFLLGSSTEGASSSGVRSAPRVEQTAYRVVQEALTNVHKHAPGAKARVRLARRPSEVAVLVENGPSERGAADAGLPSGGNGLLGMKERVTTLGGGFVSGATESGGFRVSAVIPDRTADGAPDRAGNGRVDLPVWDRDAERAKSA